MFKFALIYGMSSDDFWFGNPQDYFVFQDAFAEKAKNRHNEIDITAWTYASYNLKAFAQVYADAWGGKSHKDIFPSEPYSIKHIKKRTPRNAKEAFERFKIVAERFNR